MNVTFLLNFYYMFNLSLKITMTAKRFSTDDPSITKTYLKCIIEKTYL